MKRAASFAGVIVIALAAGCGGSPRRAAEPAPVVANQPAAAVTSADEPPPPEPELDDDDEPAPPPAPIVNTPKAPVVKLQQRGRRARAMLRFTDLAPYHCELAMDMRLAGMMALTMPTMVFGWHGRVLTSAGDDLTVRDEFDRIELRDQAAVGLPPDGIALIRTMMDPMRGAVMESAITTRGIVKHSTVTTLTALDPSIVESLANTNAGLVLPLEPIGVGGTWTVTREQAMQGMLYTTTTTYTLVSRRGTNARITAIIALAGTSAPGAPVAMTATGHGTGEFTFTGGLCSTGTSRVETSVSTPGVAGPMMQSFIDVAISPGSATVSP